MIAALYWKRTTRAGVVASMLAGTAIVIVWRLWLKQPTGIYELIPGFLGAALTLAFVSLLGRPRVALSITLGLALLPLGCASGSADALADGEAEIRYLGHAGWLVRTAEHSLVFDYTGPIDGGTLASGTLSPEALAGRRVILFASHAHGDHWKPHVLGLRDQVRDLTVVMGWDEPGHTGSREKGSSVAISRMRRELLR